MNAAITERAGWGMMLGFTALAVASFHLAFEFTSCAGLIVVFVYALLRLAPLGTARQIFYLALFVGMLIYAPQLRFFWTIFHAAAIALWLVVAVWLALFVLLSRFALQRLKAPWSLVLLPLLWTGLEYFRSELYYLRFSWLSLGYAFSGVDQAWGCGLFGVYGMGFIACIAAVCFLVRKKWSIACGGLIALALLFGNQIKPTTSNGKAVRISGVQLEFREDDVLTALEKTRQQNPNTDIFVLSEYTFNGAPPKPVLHWCRTNHTFLVAGGKDETGADYYNTAFVVGPVGEIIFKQAKSVPIQFFKDGLPARQQGLWDSPWGKIGICICYDLSYRNIVDNLIKHGAQALIVPTMDVVEWGQNQHELHGRIAPTRATEYRVPVFRLCSSGISQAIAADGKVLAKTSFPGDEEMISAVLNISDPGRLPIDHLLAPFASAVAVGFVIWLAARGLVKGSTSLKA